MLPDFDERGNLPPGVYWATWDIFAGRFALSPYRQTLLAGLRQALLALKAAGCQIAYIGGSFVSRKGYPDDWDGCWDQRSVDPTKLDAVLLQFADHCAAQKAKYHGEFYIAQAPVGTSELLFIDFFQVDKASGEPKGIVALDLRRFQ